MIIKLIIIQKNNYIKTKILIKGGNKKFKLYKINKRPYKNFLAFD